MKNILMTLVIILLVYALSFLLAGFVRKKLGRKPSGIRHFLAGFFTGTLLLFGVVLVYVSIHYSADAEALAVLKNPEGMAVEVIDGGYFLDGPGEAAALAFYPGAKVDAEAYLPLLQSLAAQGIDCFLLKMPLRLALLKSDAAGTVINRYPYDKWLVAGHSMGGVAAAGFAAGNEKSVDGVVLLASYPVKKLGDTTALLSVRGTEDKVLNIEDYENSRPNFPAKAKELVIRGGNHAQFGNYGEQSGDGTAGISRKEQQAQTVKAILEFAETSLRQP